ncbi:hypothetical protein FB563_7774 [Streptomyces puniciscabiei]|uniref:Uncharacterized protein n=1 Tax=Streptomyces puniciscabiei TaxID=164348 RepID=A0A542SZ69_9ACTN|nr:GPR1/FUN34/YaaH family transporter [Streptomyces puniciscabiei]TQK79914.1 hypothetical protein FB563_7774 [Streptomyces puniciscabiei]
MTVLLLSDINTNLLKEAGAVVPVLGLAAFRSYAAFWLSSSWIAPRLLLAGNTHNALGLFLLTLTYLLLAIGAFLTGAQPHAITQVGGWFGTLAGPAAWYAAAATVINDTHGRTLLRVGPRRTGAVRPAREERPA